MTKEDWAIAEKRALQGYKGCKLLIDRYDICLILTPDTAYKNSIAVFVNGTIKGEWYINDCEERRRFFQPRVKTIKANKDLKKMFKGLSKKQLAACKEKMKYTYYWPYWSSFTSLKNHLIKNNTSIELVNETESDAI